jgi:hypothetical protein
LTSEIETAEYNQRNQIEPEAGNFPPEVIQWAIKHKYDLELIELNLEEMDRTAFTDLTLFPLTSEKLSLHSAENNVELG